MALPRGGAREEILAERRRYEERWRTLFREGVESGGMRVDLDIGAAALLVLSAANWAYTWLAPGRDTDELADRFAAILVDGIRGYASAGEPVIPASPLLLIGLGARPRRLPAQPASLVRAQV